MSGHALRTWGMGQAMTKADLARIVYEHHGSLTNREALRLVDLLFDLVKEKLLQGEEVHIVGFGTLEVVERKPRRGRNPRTGEEILLAGRRALVFRPSRSIRSV
jgi:integration host factor subunit alpha